MDKTDRRSMRWVAVLLAVGGAIALVVMRPPSVSSQPRSPQQGKTERAVSPDITRELAELLGVDLQSAARIAQDSKIEKDQCCFAAFEGAPPSSTIPQLRCFGTRWSRAYPGECRQQKEAWCLGGLAKTLVTLHQYKLEWDAEKKECKVTPTGKEDNVEITGCTGTECR
ncbi:MAG TPA: hypothetical protein VGX68_29345 [Thermoanaerobaculia bacterium]|jgi:hypothetical protein|nr:hypothetical protein [Thermoanaerobaculia bacterium]